MNPGEADWENRPPDSANVASCASYTALGDSRVTTRTEPLNSLSPIVPVTRSLTWRTYASMSVRSGSHHRPAWTRWPLFWSGWGLTWFWGIVPDQFQAAARPEVG